MIWWHFFCPNLLLQVRLLSKFLDSIPKFHIKYWNLYQYFWRNHAQQKIDYVEEQEGELDAYEFKWNPKAKAKFSKSFTNEYKPTTTKKIHRDNYNEFII